MRDNINAQLVTITPREDTNAIVDNPDMGWVVYENYPLDQDPHGSSTLLTLPQEDFPKVAAVALMFAWSDVEKQEGVYDFSKVDYAYDYWKQRGKRIQLRMSTESLLWWNTRQPPSGQGVPGYVLAKMPADQKQTRTLEGVPYVVVDARHPFYRERLTKFLQTVAAHFTGTRAVDLVDLRGFGVWGEWHTGYQYASLEARREGLKHIIDAYAAAFPNNYLALSYSYDPDSPKEYYAGPTNRYDPAFTTTYADFLSYSAFDYALTKPNVTLRRDGVGGAVHSNERRLCEEAFHSRSRGLMMAEFMDGYNRASKGGKDWLNWFMDDALSVHPNYINLLGWQAGDALDFLKKEPDLIDKGLRSMGYRFVPTKIEYPAHLTSDARFDISMEWVNRGVGRAMRDYHLRFLLTDAQGKTISVINTGPMDTDQWIKGETYSVTRQATFRKVLPGDYELRLSVIDPVTTKPVNLPLLDGREDGSYKIGKLHCMAFSKKHKNR